jgi:sugar diacid utilization regulator
VGFADSLLALLVQDTSASALGALAEEQLRDADAASEGEIRQVVDLALQLRERLDRYKRRSTELAALYDTSGDLSSLRDVERVLEAIVRRARALLRTEVAYLMLLDEERGDAYMRVTDGTLTPGFLQIRLPLGVGLAGVVAQTARPHWTSDYVVDQRYVHAIDDAVDAEKLTAILGVPLRIGRRVLGVLLAADRHHRAWEQEEVSLLASLGAHAAIALENASLFQETRDSMLRLMEASRLIEEQNAALERATEMHERLTELVLIGGDLPGLAAAVSDVLGRDVVVTDVAGGVLARAVVGGDGGSAPLEPAPDLVDLVVEAVSTRRTLASAGETGGAHVTPIVAGESALGALVLPGSAVSAADARALQRAAMVTALLWVTQRAQDEAENRVRGELLAELLQAGPVDLEAVVRRAALIGVDLTHPVVVLVAAAASPAGLSRLRSDAVSFVTSRHGLLTVQSNALVMLLPGTDPDELARAAAQRLSAGSGEQVTVGAAGDVDDLHRLRVRVREAERCLRALQLLKRSGEGASARRLGMYALLVTEAGEELAQLFVHQRLGELEQYDAERGTSLLESVEQYFEHDGNVAQAAQSLFVHGNTLYQRLERVDTLLGPAWRSGDQALEMRLALKLRRLALG